MKSLFPSLIAALLLGCAAPPPAPPAAEEGPVIPMPTAVLAPDAKVESAAVVIFTEGPAAAADGSVYFSEINGNRILRLTPDGAFSEFRDPAGRSNGLAFDPQGRLVAAEGANTGGGRRISRTDMTSGKVETLVDSINGKRLNSPNDLVIALDGRIFFTDPRYVGGEPRELDTEDVYLIRPSGETISVATQPTVAKPNGLALSPDQKTLYVADTQPGPPREARIAAFDVQEDGTLTNHRTHYSFGSGRGIDGMAIDVEGNIYGAAGSNSGAPENHAGIYVISPDGELIGRVPIPEDPITNCTFGGPDLKTLYVTSGTRIFTIRTKNQGFLAWPTL